MRGTIVLPDNMKTVYVQSNSGNGLVRELNRVLKSSGATVVNNAAGATAILMIRSAKQDRRVLSVSSTTARAQEYELSYIVDFSIEGSHGKELYPRQTATLLRDYRFDENDVLGKGSEERILIKEMEKDMALSILRRLRVRK
ncbi:MAG: hypothetical protein KAS48_09785 [Gammaproteobacteria bacterium]|nr:hypothetical protein [Gammaproteobacteria bacterium]